MLIIVKPLILRNAKLEYCAATTTTSTHIICIDDPRMDASTRLTLRSAVLQLRNLFGQVRMRNNVVEARFNVQTLVEMSTLHAWALKRKSISQSSLLDSCFNTNLNAHTRE
eukprot:SAG31_NODE_3543_length_4142_cov_11.404622_2_plen_111_part_00